MKYTTKAIRDEKGNPLVVEITEKDFEDIKKSAEDCAKEQLELFKRNEKFKI